MYPVLPPGRARLGVGTYRRAFLRKLRAHLKRVENRKFHLNKGRDDGGHSGGNSGNGGDDDG